jgi:hypothetical protein
VKTSTGRWRRRGSADNGPGIACTVRKSGLGYAASLIFVDQSVHDLHASYSYRVQVGERCRELVSLRWELSAALVRSVFVVVGQVVAEDGEQVAGVVDQDPVQALLAYGAYPALRVGVGPGRLRRREEYLDAFGAEHGVEHGGVPRIPIANEEP